MKRDYHPGRAWILGALYFAVCIAIAIAVGVAQRIATQPLATAAQLHDAVWIGATALVTAYAVFGYAWYWPRGTTAHDRPRNPLALLFGIAWGIAQGLLVLSFFKLLAPAADAPWILALMTILSWSAFAGFWQSRFWDIHVAPDHNIVEWNGRKVLIVHVPFLVLTISHFTTYGNTALFVAWWTFALATSAWFMRFPAPWHPPSPGHDGLGVREADVS